MKNLLAVLFLAPIILAGCAENLSSTNNVTSKNIGIGVSGEDKKIQVEEKNQENTIFNQSSREYAVMGQELWSAFSCSAWASHFGDQKEAERLFLFGYEQGKKFLSAARAGKITDDDFQQEVPIGVSMSLAGPSNDFVLGVISTDAQDEALEEVFYTNYDRSKLNSDDLQKIIAENKYRDGNCQLIGK